MISSSLAEFLLKGYFLRKSCQDKNLPQEKKVFNSYESMV